MTLGITEIILTGFKNSMPYFSPGNKFLNFNSYLTVVGNAVILPCIQQQIKGEQSDEIRHSSFISSTPHEVKSTDMHCILTTNINKCRGENTTRQKTCHIFASAMYPRYQASVSAEGGLEVRGLKFIRLLRVVLSSQQRLNRPAVNAVQ